MTLLDILKENTIKVNLDSRNKSDVLRELVGILKDAGAIRDYNGTLNTVKSNAYIHSTGLPANIAVSHVKTDAVNGLKLAIGISSEGIDFDSPDKQTSKLVFLLLAAPDMSGPHVEVLADIVRLAHRKPLCQALFSAQTPRQFVELLAG